MKRSHIRPGYLLFSIMASIGKSAIVPEGFPPATANRAVGILVPRVEQETLSWYLFYLFATELGGQLYARIKKGGLQQRTNLADVAALEFPLPPSNLRRKLVAEMQAAREARKQKLREADELLASLDAYLLETVGLNPPPREDRQIYAVRLRDVPTRFDPHFHHPNFRKLATLMRSQPHARLSKVAEFSAEQWTSREGETFRYIEINGVNTETGEIIPRELPVNEAPSRAQMVVHSGDLLISLTRPHHGAISLIDATLEGAIASTGFAVLRRIETERVRPDYLWCALHSQLGLRQMLQRSSGGNYPAITEAELSKVLIPLPSLQTQDKIAAEVRRRRDEARRLRNAADAGWAAAKRRFENALLEKPPRAHPRRSLN